MDAGGTLAAAPWGNIPGPSGMHGSDRFGLEGAAHSYSSVGADFAPQWASASFASSMPSNSGFPLMDPMVALRRASQELPRSQDPVAHAGVGAKRLPSTAEDEDVQAAFSTKLSLTDISSSTLDSRGSNEAACPASEAPAPTAAQQRFPPAAPSTSGMAHGRFTNPMRKSGSEDDVFSAIGGLELGKHDATALSAADASRSGGIFSGQVPSSPSAAAAQAAGRGGARPQFGNNAVGAGGPSIGDLPFSDTPSRTLIVRNIPAACSDQELQQVFEAYGEIRSLYAACKARGLVTVSYYDLRAACLAMHSLAGAPLGDAPLDVHFPAPAEQAAAERDEGVVTVYNLDPSVTLDELYHSFVTFGDVKDIRDVPGRVNSKLIEFYDVRHAALAYKALHRTTGKQSMEHSGLPSVPELSSTSLHSHPSQENMSGWAGPGSIDSARSSQDRLAALYPGDSLMGNASSAFTVPPLDGRTGSGALPSQVAYHQQQQETLRALSSLSGDSLLPSGSGRFSSGGLGDTSAYGSMGLDATAAQAAANADAISALSRLQSGGFGGGLVGAAAAQLSSSGSGLLRSPSHGAYAPQGSLPSAFGSASAQLQSNGSGPLGTMGGRGLSMSTGDIAALMEAQAQQAQHQRRFSGSIPGAGPLWAANSQGLFNGGAASPGTSPAMDGGWAAMQQQHAAAAALGQAQRIQAVLAATPGLQNVTLEQVQALLLSGGLSAALPGLLPRSQSASSMMQHPLSAPLAARQAAAVLTKAGSGGVMGRPALGRSGSRERELGGRAPRRSADAGGDMERRNVQERMFAMNVPRVLSGEDTRTTLMIKNIPNKYTQKMLLAAIDDGFKGTYDFFYLPIDFKNKCNVGYAFINMIRPVYIVSLVERFNDRKWEKFNSEKVCQITYARIQGKQAMVQHFQNSSLLQEDKRCRPVLFHSEGPLAGAPEPFPMGPGVRTRARGPAREAPRDLRPPGLW